jgi:signal transduction histidine kinase
LLTQALENLFRNCVEHGGETVTVRLEPLEDGFAVVDDGPGIPDHRRDQLFAAGVTTRPDGTGIGLAIVDEIVSMHGWSADIANDPDRGARVTFSDVRCRKH